MSLDSITLAAMREELLEKFKEGKIVSLIQTKKYKIVLEINSAKPFSPIDSQKSTIFYLHISLDPSLPEIYFTKSVSRQKTIASPFLALLQNQLKGGKILDIQHPNFDRILHFIIQPYQKFGQLKNKILIMEFMGKHSNMILLKEDKTIETALKILDSKINRYREIMPGKIYVPPPAQNKINPLNIKSERFFDIFNSLITKNKELTLRKAIQDSFAGLNLQTAKEVIFQANLFPEKNLSEISQADLKVLWASFNEIMIKIKNHYFQPALFLEPSSKKIKAWSIIDSIQFTSFQRQTFADANSCLEFLFCKLEKDREILSLQNKIDQIIRKNHLKINNKINDCQKKLEEVKNCEHYKICGELIKANLSDIKRGNDEFRCINYYSPQQKNITIPLKQRLTPLENARLYFKKYRKAKDSFQIIFAQLKSHEDNIARLFELKKLFEQEINSLPGLLKIFHHLTELGWAKKGEASYSKKPQKEKNKNRLLPVKYISQDGWEIYVGKNNLQNDFLTFKLASGNDTWLHAKNIQGSHVIIRNKGEKHSLPLGTLIQAANLAAYFSKAKKDNKILVDYTFKKHVKKPKNAKPGMVIYSQEKSLWIQINAEEVRGMEKISQK